MKIRYYIIGFFSGIVILALMASLNADTLKSNNSNVTALRDSTNQYFQVVKNPHIPNQIFFAGEEVPISEEDSRERFEIELIRNCYYHSSSLMHLKRAGRYFPIIEPILKAHNVPDDFKYLAVAESDLTNAVSPAGAKGLWQFLELAGKEYGLTITATVDERFNVEASTVAACKYLLYLHRRFGSWSLAAAAYNAGPTKLAAELKSQGESTYYALNLNQETSKYVFRIAAIKQIMENAELYGFFIKPQDIYVPFGAKKSITVTSSITNLGNWSREHGMTYRELKYYNPWLRSDKLEVEPNQSFVLKVK